MADINTGINAAIKNTGPFGMEPAETQLGAFGQGMLKIPSWLYNVNQDIGDAIVAAPGQIINYLGSPTEYGQQKIDANAKAELQKLIEADPTLLGKFGGLESVVDIPQIDMSGLEDFTTGAEYQEAAEKKRAEEAEAFRAKEKQLVDSKGGLNTMSLADSAAITQDNIEQASIAAMNDYIEG